MRQPGLRVRNRPRSRALVPRKAAIVALVPLLAACAQSLGGTYGDPTRVAAAERANEAPRVSRIVQAMAQSTLADAGPDADARSRSVAGSASAAKAARAAEPASAVEIEGRNITVGPNGDVRTIGQAARIARDGDTVEVQAGEYRGDVAVWPQKRLTLRATGGRAVLVADGKAAEGKAIWVIRNGHFEVEGFDFVGARVADRNGAGIRFAHGTLIVRDSRFLDNENGILTGNDGRSTLVVERSLFARNGHGDGYSHGIYAGRIARLEVRGSYFHSGRTGHLLKSRARENRIEYNRITDEDGDSSYELEIAEGGRALVVGNIIEQSAKTSNHTIVSYAAGGYRWPENELVMSHNTLVNRRPAGGLFVRARAGPAEVVLVDNVWAGRGRIEVQPPVRDEGNVQLPLSALPELAAGSYRLSESAVAGTTRTVGANDWLPSRQYVHERGTEPLRSAAAPLPGALQQ